MYAPRMETGKAQCFAPGLAADDARLGADVVRYSFIVVDLHHLLLAGLPAHCHRNRALAEVSGSQLRAL